MQKLTTTTKFSDWIGVINNILPDITGNSNKVLVVSGTAVAWKYLQDFNNAIAEDEIFTISQDYPSGLTLTLSDGRVYYKGKHQLRITMGGLGLREGIDFTEQATKTVSGTSVATEYGDECSTIDITTDVRDGFDIDVWIEPLYSNLEDITNNSY